MFKGCGCRGEGCCCGKLGGSGLGGGTGRRSGSTVDILMPAAGEEIWSKSESSAKMTGSRMGLASRDQLP